MAAEAAGPAVACHGQVVIPGDRVVEASSLGSASVIRVGTGLSEQGVDLVASRSGTVKVLAGTHVCVCVYVCVCVCAWPCDCILHLHAYASGCENGEDGAE